LTVPEWIIAEAIRRWYLRVDDPFGVVRSAHLSDRGLQLTLDTAHCANIIARLADNELILDRTPDRVTILLPIILPARGGRHLVVPAHVRPPQVDRILVSALRKAHAMLATDRGLPTMETAPPSPYDRNILRLAFLAPNIQQAILDGRQPQHLNLEALKSIELPLSWPKQRELLRFRP
jgi:site-specific DNA recombinase